MRKFLIFLILATAVLFSCEHYSARLPMGIVHLSVLKEDGSAFKKSDAKRFLLEYFDNATEIKTTSNYGDDLVFICTDMINIYRAGDELNDNDIKKSLDSRYWFALKDKRGEYKTVRKSYIDSYKTHIKNPEERKDFKWCDYIYRCEVKLEKK